MDIDEEDRNLYDRFHRDGYCVGFRRYSSGGSCYAEAWNRLAQRNSPCKCSVGWKYDVRNSYGYSPQSMI